MRDVLFYVTKAIERTGCKSERQLCLMMDMADSSITNYRNKNVLPTDETMEKLCKLAGVDPFIGMLDLNIWRSRGPAQTVYKKLLEKITIVAVTLVLAYLGALSPAQAGARAVSDVTFGVEKHEPLQELTLSL